MLTQANSEYISIYVRTYNGNGCRIRMPLTNSFSQLINLINLHDLQLPSSYTILHHGKYIRNYSETLHHLGIVSDSILHIEQTKFHSQLTPKMDVSISLDKQTFVVSCFVSDTVQQIKQNVYKLIQINPKHQVLVFNGKILENAKSISSYKIVPNSLICLISKKNKPEQKSEVFSDYENILNDLIKKEVDLLQSVLSVCQKKISKTSLFRSQSIDKKKILQMTPVQIQIHQNNNDQDSSISDCRQFNFDLFKTIGICPMTLSVNHNQLTQMRNNMKPKNALERKITFFKEDEWSFDLDSDKNEQVY